MQRTPLLESIAEQSTLTYGGNRIIPRAGTEIDLSGFSTEILPVNRAYFTLMPSLDTAEGESTIPVKEIVPFSFQNFREGRLALTLELASCAIEGFPEGTTRLRVTGQREVLDFLLATNSLGDLGNLKLKNVTAYHRMDQIFAIGYKDPTQ